MLLKNAFPESGRRRSIISRQEDISPAAKWAMIIVGCLMAMVVIGFGRISYGVVMPFMQKSLGLDYIQAGWIGTANSLGYVLLVAFAGPLASRYGNKATAVTGVFTVCLSMVCLAAANTFYVACAAMIIMGLGTALTFTPMVSMLISWMPVQRGMVTGLINGAIGFGMLVSGIMVPLLVSGFPASGWRVSWMVFGVVAFLVTAGAVAFLRNPPSYTGSTRPEIESWRKTLYFNRNVLFIAFAYFFVGFAYLIPQTFNMAFMIDSGLSKYTAGIIISVSATLSLFSGLVWGTLSDRVGRRTILTLILGLTSLSPFIPVIHQGAAAFAVASLIAGVAVSGVFGLIMTRASELVDYRLVPETLSYVTLFFGVGQLLSPAMAGWIIQHTADFRPAFILSGVVFLLALYFTHSVRENAAFRPGGEKQAAPLTQA